ncbi:probable RNA-binding protein 19 [Phymastichus coffea]|uniref:probable RNA-binding protein 19 n=1 Tax=Phymastichus coffea TaxID=108790 RepID=UPI00273C31CC|nr:probable RNA-binding protein 19 [Phymastichus coffea]XP_058794675.1 probable RNA-binding protein 19 [Phymastichus coffea]
MSRLIVKNLPKNITDEKLKKLFGEYDEKSRGYKYVITDVQRKFTEDGKFRRFAFIGYKSEEDAAAALEYFNNTCIDTSRITVQYCASLGDPSKPKAWSKYALDNKTQTAKDVSDETEEISKKKRDKTKENDGKKNKKKNKKDEDNNKIKEILEMHKDDPLFNEFIESHTKGDKKLWSNDTLLGVNEEEEDFDSDENSETQDSESETDDKSKNKLAKKNISDKEYMESLQKKKIDRTSNKQISELKESRGPNKFFTVKVRGLAYNHKKKDIKLFFKGLQPKSIRVPPKIKGIAYVGFKTEKQMKKALNKNKSILEGRSLIVTKYKEKEKNITKNENKYVNLRWKQQEESLKNEENVAESGKIFLRNLAYTTTEEDIAKLFEKYGPLTEVDMPIDKATRKPKGFATVTFLMPEHAVTAFTELDGTILNGRLLHLLPAKTKAAPTDLLDQDGLNYKQKKELQLKATAKSTHNWNTLFLGANAVADAIAKQYNTTKEKILQHSNNGPSIAVNLALGETLIVQETQKFMEEQGVRLNAFNQTPSKRSKTIILVKNLPSGTKNNELVNLFEKHGELARVVLPPSGITALVEFFEPSEARHAFNRLAYSKFKHLPLYLEWAPDDSFVSAPTKSDDKNPQQNTSAKTSQNSTKMDSTTKLGHDNTKPENTNDEDDEDEDEPEPDTTLFVKNLNFSTTEAQLKKHFAKCGAVHYATISMKKDPKDPANKLSMGYGFVRYKFKSDMERALKQLQTSTLDGKTLDLKRSERTLQTEVKSQKKTAKITNQTGTKILVRNVPFQANADEIKDLFKAFGEIKGVRLPKKLVGDEKHRGFGFVEFYTKKEANRAFKALCQSTHLYGRRLVLEWAQTEEGIEDIRKRTAKHFHEESAVKRSKKGTLDPESIGLEVN